MPLSATSPSDTPFPSAYLRTPPPHTQATTMLPTQRLCHSQQLGLQDKCPSNARRNSLLTEPLRIVVLAIRLSILLKEDHVRKRAATVSAHEVLLRHRAEHTSQEFGAATIDRHGQRTETGAPIQQSQKRHAPRAKSGSTHSLLAPGSRHHNLQQNSFRFQDVLIIH